jgi:hypothetical protein
MSDCTEAERHELELFLDGELDGARREALSGRLRAEPGLREELGRATRADELARAALLASPEVSAWRGVTVTRRLAIACAAAACLCIGVGLAMSWRGPAAPGKGMTKDVQVAVQPPPALPRMVVLSFPLKAPAPESAPLAADVPILSGPTAPVPGVAAAPAGNTPMPLREFVGALDAALARGDFAAASALLVTDDAELRAAGNRRLAGVLRSVSTARRVLEDLPAAARLAACRELAAEPRWRTIACVQLTALRADDATRDAVDLLLTELARNPDLTPLVERVRGTPSWPRRMDRSL